MGVGLGGGPSAVVAPSGPPENRTQPMPSLHTSARRRNSSASKRSFMDLSLVADVDSQVLVPATPEPAASLAPPNPSATHSEPTHPRAPATRSPPAAPQSEPPARKQRGGGAEGESAVGVATRRAKESGRGAKAGPSKAESPRAADPPGRTAAPAKQSSMPPPVGKAKSKVQKTYGRKQKTVQLPEALDVFGGV